MKESLPVRAGALTDVFEEDWKPFSLVSTVMIDEQTQHRYEVLPPVAQPGKKYLPAGFSNVLLPGEARMVSIQFASPPAPPAAEGRDPPKQTVSFCINRREGADPKSPSAAPSSR
jgi:hypothetical protein